MARYIVVTTVWAGLSLGALYGLVALGYTITYLGSAVFNFAQASLVMTGVFLAYWGLHLQGLSTVLVVLLGAVAVAALATVEERVAVRPVRSHENLLITTVGVATLIDGVIVRLAGDQPLQVPFHGPSTTWTVFGGRVLPVEVYLIAGVIAAGITLAVLSRRTLIGLAGLALSEDREAAILRGIHVRRYSIGAFALAGVLAGALGFLVGPKTFAFATLSSSLALKGFVALALGGFGSFTGAAAGGLICGVVEAFAARYLGVQYQLLSLFAVLLVTLLLFPTGVFGRRRLRAV